jgi:membrane protease YdiL (CAAX protease family)
MVDRPTLFIKQYALTIFCALTIALTFAATLLPLPAEVIPVVMVFIPAGMAISLASLAEGKAGVQPLLGKLTRWRISLKWAIIAVVLGFVMRVTISLIALGLGLIPAIQLRPMSIAQFVILALMLFIFALPEELGWRGYTLPKLLRQYSPLAASLIIGILWGLLHLALHLPRMMYAGLPLLPTLLQLIALSVITTWLYTHTGGNVLLTSLFHAAQSFFVILNEGILLMQLVWIMAGVYLSSAFIIAMVSGSSFVQKPVATIQQGVETARISRSVAGK